MKNQKETQTANVTEQTKIAFRATLQATGDDGHTTTILQSTPAAYDTEHLGKLVQKVLDFMEIRAPHAIQAAKVRNYKKDETGNLQLSSSKPRANQVTMTIEVLSTGKKWSFGTLENIPAPYTLSEKVFTKISHNVARTLFENIYIHAMDTDETVLYGRLQSMYGSLKDIEGKNATILNRRTEIIGLLRGFSVGEFIASEAQN